ncbi:hypothetical protein ACFRAU_14390 [Arthrobacter sp. NPDC056691]|uniref:hypothetical protein n=1 Tax=Arthrobacter sp. NPDC056691 TaxID=3345913 RepID=UPI00366F9F13
MAGTQNHVITADPEAEEVVKVRRLPRGYREGNLLRLWTEVADIIPTFRFVVAGEGVWTIIGDHTRMTGLDFLLALPWNSQAEWSRFKSRSSGRLQPVLVPACPNVPNVIGQAISPP